jgi:predicted RecB family nuclease
MLEYLAWLDDGDQGHLDRILRYNEEDCRATLAVLAWLRRLGD